jgi:hypothetical protein
MLIDDCRRLMGRIAEKERLRRHLEQLSKFEGVRTQLQQRAVARVVPLVSSWVAMREAGIDTVPHDAAARPLLAEVGTLLASFRADPEAALDPRQLRPRAFFDAVEGVAARLETALRGAWQQHTAAQAVTTNRELLDVLERLPRFRSAIQRIRALVDRVRQAQAVLPAGAAQITSFHQLVADTQAAWQEIGGDQMPPEVLVFLRGAVGPTGARLDQLTETVRAWLAEHRLAGAFSIRAGN